MIQTNVVSVCRADVVKQSDARSCRVIANEVWWRNYRMQGRIQGDRESVAASCDADMVNTFFSLRVDD